MICKRQVDQTVMEMRSATSDGAHPALSSGVEREGVMLDGDTTVGFLLHCTGLGRAARNTGTSSA